MFEWPSILETLSMGTPLESVTVVANVWRAIWNEMLRSIPQTSAISSGTSGCYEVHGQQAQVNYIDTNKIALKADVARGNGETLDGLMTMLGCKEVNAVKMEIKNDYKNIFNTEDTQEIFKAIKSNETVQKSCTTLG